jgi:hypothetical protein
MKVPADKLPLSEAFQKYLKRWRDRAEGGALSPDEADEEAYDAASELRRAFERGDLVAEVYDGTRELWLTAGQWEDAGFPERPFFGGAIAEVSKGALADYAGLDPYTDEAVFNGWLARQFDDDAPSIEATRAALTQKAVNRSRGRRPKAKESAEWAIKELFPDGRPDMKHAALVEMVNAKLKESGKPKVSSDTIARAIGVRSDHRKTAN